MQQRGRDLRFLSTDSIHLLEIFTLFPMQCFKGGASLTQLTVELSERKMKSAQ